MKPQLKSIRLSKAASIGLLLLVFTLYGHFVLNNLQQRTELYGSYVTTDHAVTLHLSDLEGAYAADLRIGDTVYEVDVDQVATGKLSGTFLASREHPFTLVSPLYTAFLPPRFQALSFSSEGNELKLKRLYPDGVNLQGQWESIHGKLLIVPDRDGWVARLMPAFDKHSILSFQQKGARLLGSVQQGGQLVPINGAYTAIRFPLIAFQFGGIDYRFRPANVVAEHGFDTQDVMLAFNGVFKNQQIAAHIGVRHGFLPGKERAQQWRCDGRLKKGDDVRDILGCGLEKNRLWIQYRSGTPDNPNFGTTYASLTRNGIRLTGQYKGTLVSAADPPIPGVYGDRSNQLELIQGHLTRWEGSLYWEGQHIRFNGEFVAGIVEAVTINDSGDSGTLTIVQRAATL